MPHVFTVVAVAMLLAVGGERDLVAQQAERAVVTGPHAFGIEALGGTVGSALGIALGLAVAKPADCPADDVVCTLERLGVTGIVGVVGATVGTVVAGRSQNTEPSTVGAFVGGAAGLAAGIGLEHLITEELNKRIGNAGTLVLFSVTQGILAAAGSRLLRW